MKRASGEIAWATACGREARSFSSRKGESAIGPGSVRTCCGGTSCGFMVPIITCHNTPPGPRAHLNRRRQVMLTRHLAVLASTAFLALATTTASAVTAGGDLDGNAHPYVGLLVAKDAAGTPMWTCSGTLIAPRLVLTAGHCTETPAARIEVWFDADVENGYPENGFPFTGDAGGTPYTHPSYNPNAFYLFDLGMVVLDKPVKMKKYGALPSLNVLDDLATARGTQN